MHECRRGRATLQVRGNPPVGIHRRLRCFESALARGHLVVQARLRHRISRPAGPSYSTGASPGCKQLGRLTVILVVQNPQLRVEWGPRHGLGQGLIARLARNAGGFQPASEQPNLRAIGRTEDSSHNQAYHNSVRPHLRFYCAFEVSLLIPTWRVRSMAFLSPEMTGIMSITGPRSTFAPSIVCSLLVRTWP